MNIKDIKNLLNNELKQELTDDNVNSLILDFSRFIDKEINEIITQYKKVSGHYLTTPEKELLRKYLLGYPINNDYNLDIYKFNDSQLNSALTSITNGLERNYNLVFNSLLSRAKSIFELDNKNITEEYINYLKESEKDRNQLVIISSDNLTSDNLTEIVSLEYNSLSNAHYMIILFKDTKDNLVNWKTISDIAIFMENFKCESDLTSFNKIKEAKKKELEDTILNNEFISEKKGINDSLQSFFTGVNYGFIFEDLIISSNAKEIALVMKKIEYDKDSKKCPSCLSNLSRSNSTTKILLRSFECQNPTCPDRSKIGRGKRFDINGAKRQTLLKENNPDNIVPTTTYKNFRKDIILSDSINISELIRLYSYATDKVCLVNCETLEHYNREITTKIIKNFSEKDYIKSTSFYKLFQEIALSILPHQKNNNIYKSESIQENYIVNSNSAYLEDYIKKEKLNIIGSITSPPYYNAREYSQWPNLLCYLVDMLTLAKGVYNVLDKNGVYIYNIGDIVSQENIYTNSSTSKKRTMLGFYSIFIFSLIGYNINKNIIWDKGEVQSKRNSTPNRFSGYLKPINVYEHCLVFSKNEKDSMGTEIVKISPVLKINSLGKNTYGHTAPYPEELVKIILPYIQGKNGYVLDSFLGSGTTVLALMNTTKIIGFEMNEIYYNLSLERINNKANQFTLFDL